MNTQPHLDLSKAGCPGRVRMNLLGESRQEAQGRKTLLQVTLELVVGMSEHCTSRENWHGPPKK